MYICVHLYVYLYIYICVCVRVRVRVRDEGKTIVEMKQNLRIRITGIYLRNKLTGVRKM
jgi:hypothetical protein